MGDQARRPIYEELLSVPGIADAQFEGDPNSPESVRVQLAPGADPEVVGREVSRVLAGHGMRSQMTVPAVAPASPPPPPEPRTVVNLADFDPAKADREIAEPGPVDAPVAKAAEVPDRSVPDEREPSASEDEAASAEADAGLDTAGPLELSEVTVRQRSTDVRVTVSAGDLSVERLALPTEEGIDRALLEAVCEVLGLAPVPALVSVTTGEQTGVVVVSVLLYDGTAHRAGSAVSTGSRERAVARALWSALSGPA